MRRLLAVVLLSVSAFPPDAHASDHEPPRVVMHGSGGQTQRAGLSGFEWWSGSAGEMCPQGPQPHADVFGAPKGRIEVRAGARLRIRFHTPRQPSSLTIRSYAPPNLVPSTLQPYAPDGSVEAWDARFDAPRFKGRARNLMWADGRWTDEHCSGYTQWATWSFTLKRKQ